ncbi:hypothetical protein Pmani_037600, partial [Petrolisthes manimaculis]
MPLLPHHGLLLKLLVVLSVVQSALCLGLQNNDLLQTSSVPIGPAE